MQCHPACLGACKVCLAKGERRKAAALDFLAQRREAFVRRAKCALLTTLLETGSATADAVRGLVELPLGINPKCFGAAPESLARAGIIRAGGFVKTGRPEGHARPLTLWGLADRAAAVRWLETHPDLPDPGDDDPPAVQGVLFPTNPANEPAPAVAAAGAGVEV